MQQYNIDFFDFDLDSIHHDTVADLSIDADYLSPTENTIEISKTDKVDSHDIIYIKDLNNFLGIVTKVSTTSYTTEISFKPFISIFDHDVLLNINDQKNKSLEATIRDKISEYWIGSSAGAENISILNTPTTTTSTTGWRMNLKADQDGSHYCITGLYSTLISKAMSKYRIAVTPSLDFTSKKINIAIGKNTESVLDLEADLYNVTIDTFTLKEPSTSTNKLEVWNASNYNTVYYYYLHPDGSYSRSSSNRIKPTVLQVSAVTPSDGQTFSDAAEDEAGNVFSGIEWTNLIELTLDLNDDLVKPATLKHGQRVNVIHDGTSYSSILTGKKILNSETITLVFGTIRYDLTKKLKKSGG